MTSSNIYLFLESKPDKPKVVLFADLAAPPFYLKGLAHSFFDTMHIGFARKNETVVAEKYKITTYPSLILIRRRNEKPLYYKGEMRFQSLVDFINPYSEKFVVGDPKAKMKEEGLFLIKPWLSQDLPELSKESAEDVCYKTHRLCAIYVSNAEPDEATKTLFVKLKSKYAKDARFAFMWLRAPAQTAFFNVLKLDTASLPKLVFLNTGSLKRTLVHGGDMTEASIDKTVDSIYNSDARFAKLSVQTLPTLAPLPKENKQDL